MEKCRRDILHWFHWWVWTFDPRPAAEGKLTHLPFDLFPKQIEFIRWLEERLAAREEGLTEKSRDIGFTWLVGGFAAHKWLYVDGFTSTFGSRIIDLVDKSGDPNSILEKIRMLILGLPHWMLPRGFNQRAHFNYCRIINPEKGSIIVGEGGDNMGRGGRSTLYVIDEAAFIERAELVAAATSANSNVRIWGSTVNGPGNYFFRKRHDGSLKPHQIFRFHYSNNPLMTPELIEAKRNQLEPHVWASEYEIDYSASVEGICIPSKWVESAKKIAGLITIEPAVDGIAGGDVGGGGKGKSVLICRFGPVVTLPKAWGEPDTIETAHRMLDAAQSERFFRADGAPCTVRTLRFDSVGVGQGVEAALAHSNRDTPTTAGVNVGNAPSDMSWPDGETSAEKFANLKAEAWWLMRERFKLTHEMVLFLEGKPGGQQHPASDLISLPDDTNGPDATALATQISLPKWQRNEKGKILIEPKQKLAARGIASPDYAEALVLTFTGYSSLEVWMKLAS